MAKLGSKNIHNNDKLDSAMMILNENTPFAIREAFRTLYTNIIYLPIPDKSRKIAITSALPGETKTFVSINLAITLAENYDKGRILLIDTDMRKPRVERLIKNLVSGVTEVGLSEYLAGITDTPNILATDIPNLSVLFSGATCLNPSGLISSERMTELVKACESEFDYIIFDTPPLNIVSDATLLASRINGYLIATRADYSNINEISDAIETLEKVKANIFGFVMSDVQIKKTHGYNYKRKYYSNYSYGYGYGRKEKDK